MKLYLLEQKVNNGYDTFDSMVVAAEDVVEAVKIHPDGPNGWEDDWGTWAPSVEDVKCTLIGTAVKGTKAGIILSSFNAG